MRPSHEKSSKRHLNHKGTEKLKVQIVLSGFQMTFWRPPNSDFQGPCESEAQPHPPSSPNYEAQPRESFKKAPAPHKSIEKPKVQLVLTGFQMTFWKPPNLDFQGPCEGEAQPHPPPSRNYQAHQQENSEQASGPHKHRKATSSINF
jgi:hypothetical protein